MQKLYTGANNIMIKYEISENKFKQEICKTAIPYHSLLQEN